MAGSPLRVLVVDDSSFMRQLITSVLAAEPDIEVVGAAPDALIAREKIKALNPDVVTLDIEMPHMDGLEFLRRLMNLRPTRVLMISSLTTRNAEATLSALRLGAVDCLEKPSGRSDGEIAAFAAALRLKLAACSSARLGAAGRRSIPIARRPAGGRMRPGAVVAIGASTGGVEALDHLLHALPDGLPPIVIVQHMPAKFTASLARRLDHSCSFEVIEARDGLTLGPGRAVIAPGGMQLEIRNGPQGLACRVFEAPPVSGHAPSADVMFGSVARVAGRDAIGVILTGMGRDGARGLLAMREAGACTFGQDEASSLVYGMPRAAAEIGAVGEQVPLESMAEAIVAALAREAGAGKVRSAEIQP